MRVYRCHKLDSKFVSSELVKILASYRYSSRNWRCANSIWWKEQDDKIVECTNSRLSGQHVGSYRARMGIMVLGSTVRKRSSSLVKILLYTHLTASWGAGSRAAPGFFLGLGLGFVPPPKIHGHLQISWIFVKFLKNSGKISAKF